MDKVAEKAGLSKGLLYYYFKTKQILFRELFNRMLEKNMALNTALLDKYTEKNPMEKLVLYIWEIINLAKGDARLIRFAIRLPFDAYAVFGPDKWQAGLIRAGLFQKTLENLVHDLVLSEKLTEVNPAWAAENIWAVVIVNAFSISKMTGGETAEDRASTRIATAERLQSVLSFCFQGLGITHNRWNNIIKEMKHNKRS